MEIKEGGVMDIQKQHEGFDLWWESNAIAMMCEEDEALKIWQAAKAVPEWINVHLLSPQIDTEVLICVDDDVQLAVWRVGDCGGYFEDAIGEIKWWMPLPKAQEPTNE